MIVAAEPSEVVAASGSDAFGVLDRLRSGWWAALLAYDLGRAVERVRYRVRDDLGIPDLVLARYDARLVLDGGRTVFEGSPRAVRRLAHLLSADRRAWSPPRLGPPRSSLSREEFEAGVRAVVALVEAGECYQVNLTRRLSWERPVDAPALFSALATTNPVPHAALACIPLPDGRQLGVVCASPERFLSWRGREVETRPVKGTARNPDFLRASAKDRAENVMIADLARNDLGRVCEFGSVHVPALASLEEHPGLFHLVSTVRGRLRDDVGLGSLVRATFPPASVTGAPKPRVLQAIEDLEPVRRGVYCGAVGWVDGDRATGDLAVAIRTFTTLPDSTYLGTGGGIVADSDPSAEWEETELKVSRLLDTAGAGPATAHRVVAASELAAVTNHPQGGGRYPAPR